MNQEDFSINFIIKRLKSLIYFFIKKYKTYFFTITSSVFFLISYNYILSPVYHAYTNFVIEDDKSSKLSDLSSIASIAGFNTSSMLDGSSLFQIDNIQELFMSNSILKKTLLTEKIFNQKKQKIIDRYIESESLKKRYASYNQNHPLDFSKKSRLNDSIIKIITKNIKEKNLVVSKPNRKTSIINVSFFHKDQILSKEFNQTIVQNVIDLYFEIKNRKSSDNILILKNQTDSIKKIIDISISKLAIMEENVPNPNPLLKSNKIPSQIEMLNLQANTSIYAEVVKQLELAKVTQRNKSPIIQIIDGPILPLENSRLKFSSTIMIGILLGFIFNTTYYFLLILFDKIKL